MSPLGFTTAENFARLVANDSGIRQHTAAQMHDQPFYAALFNPGALFLPNNGDNAYTKFEQLLIASVNQALQGSGINAADKETVLIVSSTKGNITLLETETNNPELQKRVSLPASAKLVAGHFGFINKPVVVSNACISGLLAILTGMRLIQYGQFRHAVVTGADVISKFILSGFQSFQAISPAPCKPFDENRSGITLGEGAATVILSADQKYAGRIMVAGGSVSNDANHISGPSRTGGELAQAIANALLGAGLSPSDVSFISAHGTATPYNDEMEAKGITLAGLETVPVNSLKGYYGHTLGAAGLIESVVSIRSLQENLILPTKGFDKIGVSKPVNVCSSPQNMPLQHCLKTASGFGGCNAALVLSKTAAS